MALTADLVGQVIRHTPAGLALLDPELRILLANPALHRLAGREAGGLEGRSTLELVHPEDRGALEVRLRRSDADPRERVAVRWLAPDGSVCESECAVLGLEQDGRPLRLLVALEVTPARKLAHRTQSLSRFASAMALSTSVPDALDALARSVVESTAAVACAVVVLDRPARPGEGVPSIRTMGTHNLPEDWARVAERLWQSGEPLPPRRALATGRTVLQVGPPEPLRDIAEQAGLETIASVPMWLQGRIVGIVNCLFRSRTEVDETELSFIETLAPLAAVVAENARLFAGVRETVRTQERQHLARELHDSVSQTLYGIGLGARTALKLVATDPGQAVEPLEYVLSLAEAALAEMRALLLELQPECLQREGIVAALRTRAGSLRGLQVEASFCEEPDLAPEAKHGLFRIASEALHNVVKHADATRVRLALSREGGSFRLEVADDGRGFEPGRAVRGMGLSSMRERARELKGSLSVESGAGGTRVLVTVPGAPG